MRREGGERGESPSPLEGHLRGCWRARERGRREARGDTTPPLEPRRSIDIVVSSHPTPSHHGSHLASSAEGRPDLLEQPCWSKVRTTSNSNALLPRLRVQHSQATPIAH